MSSTHTSRGGRDERSGVRCGADSPNLRRDSRRHLVEKQAAELRQLTDRIAAMEQREAALKKALGGS